MRYYHYGHAAVPQGLEYAAYPLRTVGIYALGRFVQKEQFRLRRQHFGQRHQLLLAAGQVVGVFVHKAVYVVRKRPGALARILKLLAHCVLKEYGLDVLREHGKAVPVEGLVLVIADVLAEHFDSAAVRLVEACRGAQARGLAAAVASQYAEYLALLYAQCRSAEHIVKILSVAEPDVVELHRGNVLVCCSVVSRGPEVFRRAAVLRFSRSRKHRLYVVSERFRPGAAFAYRKRAVALAAHDLKEPYRAGHRRQKVRSVRDLLAHLPCRSVVQKPPLVHDKQPARRRDDFLQTVLDHYYGKAHVRVEFADRCDKIGRRNGVQLAGGLVQDQQTRLHHHYGRQVQKLLLAAGKIRDVHLEPVFYVEIAGDLRHPAADDVLRHPQVLQPEGQLVPDLVRHYLMLRPLHDETHSGGRSPCVYIRKGHAVQQHLAADVSHGDQLLFEHAKKRGLSAARRTADSHESSLVHAETDAAYGILFAEGVFETQISDCKDLHLASSLI